MSAEQDLRDLVEERARAVREGDAATLAARLADDIITFHPATGKALISLQPQ